jgi:hypothetical protein
VPTPRHASHAAFDPVETVTPPHISVVSLMTKETPLGAHRADWLVLHLPFYSYLLSGVVVLVIALQDAVKDGI